MAQPKKKIIIKKKSPASKSPEGSSDAEGKKDAEEEIKAPKIKMSKKKKIQIGKKKAAKSSTQTQNPPPEIVSSQNVDKNTEEAVERQKTMIAELPKDEESSSKPETPDSGSSTSSVPASPDSEAASVSESKGASESGKNPSFKFYCIRCGQKLEAYDEWVDREITCPRCSAKIKIPAPLP